ncbi:MAG TPA: type III pantothenate kinase [Acidimicrobiales bacterium]|nr:type III pantothenate kinase [Acidimicrobiales bacterium]
MLLTIDVGNTQTVLGIFPDGRSIGNEAEAVGNIGNVRSNRPELIHHWRVATNAERTADEHALLISELLGLEGIDSARQVTGIALSSTVPRLTAAIREMITRWFDVESVILEPGVRTGTPILYDDPREVGADRIANAVGAFAQYGGPTIVVDFGTATTFDCISKAGEYLGGAIVPGIEISMDALFAHAAALRRVELVEPRRIIGKNTVESIQTGAVYGFASQAEGLCRKLEEEMGESKVVLTGGLAEVIAPHLSIPHFRDPWLTLHGLRIVFERNVPMQGVSGP